MHFFELSYASLIVLPATLPELLIYLQSKFLYCTLESKIFSPASQVSIRVKTPLHTIKWVFSMESPQVFPSMSLAHTMVMKTILHLKHQAFREEQHTARQGNTLTTKASDEDRLVRQIWHLFCCCHLLFSYARFKKYTCNHLCNHSPPQPYKHSKLTYCQHIFT